MQDTVLDPKGFSFWKAIETGYCESVSYKNVTCISYRQPEEGPLCGEGSGCVCGGSFQTEREQEGQPKQRRDNKIIIITGYYSDNCDMLGPL